MFPDGPLPFMSECILTLPPVRSVFTENVPILQHQRVCPSVVGNLFLMYRAFVCRITENSLFLVDPGLHPCRTRPISPWANPFTFRVYILSCVSERDVPYIVKSGCVGDVFSSALVLT